MPIYEYECEQCGVRFEKTQRFTDATLTDCPECNGHVHRVMQPVGVIFRLFWPRRHRQQEQIIHGYAQQEEGRRSQTCGEQREHTGSSSQQQR